MGPIGCPETSVANYKSTLRDIGERRRLEIYFAHSGDLNMELQAAPKFVLADQNTRRHKAEDHSEGPSIGEHLLNTNRSLIKHYPNTNWKLAEGKPNTEH